ncbi:MAG: plasmid pRiA4b ORF-3 family protein, partial [Treponema sp.]|nr:plasmid pRiA4b ORF-3 family protein [Treponema sp.]
VCLSRLDLQPKQKFRYLYDFGDSWLHEITVSKIIPIGAENGELMRPRCLEGERAGPLEDSGGIWGYEEMLEILKNPDHERYEEIYAWAGDIDPEDADLEEINARLEQVFKPRKPRGTKGTGKSRKGIPSSG